MSDITSLDANVRWAAKTIEVIYAHSRSRLYDRLVLLAIASDIGPWGAWPSMPTLATYAGCSRRTVTNAIRRLIDLGEITVESRSGSAAMNPRHRTNLYRITLRCPDGCCGGPELDPWDTEADQ